jgi:integrase
MLEVSRGGPMPEATGIRTDVEVRALSCPPDLPFIDINVHDPKFPGLQVRVYRTGRKVFFLLYRFNRERKRLKLGLYTPPDFGLAAARRQTSLKLAEITTGADPAGEASEARAAKDVAALYGEFEKDVVKRFPPKTRTNWNGSSRRFLEDIGALPLTATDEICDRVMALHKRVGLEEGKEAQARTIFKHVTRFFRWAVAERRIKPSHYPFGGMRSRFRDKKRTRYYDPDEVRRLLQAIRRPQTWWPEDFAPEKVTKAIKRRAEIHRCYFLLLWYLGCRRGALASLKWSEIKPDHASQDAWLWYRPTSKNSDPLEIPLSSYAIGVIEELRAITGGKGFVFPAERSDGESGHRSDSWKPVARLQAASRVSDFTNHAVRKTISTYLTRSLDVPNDVVTAILNHRLPGPKANENYIQALPVRRMRDALEAWGAHLEGLAAATPAARDVRGRKHSGHRVPTTPATTPQRRRTRSTPR